MKHRSYVVLPFLLVTVFVSALVPGFSIATHPIASYGPIDQGLQVWFDNPQFLSTGPCAYQLNVHAQTSNGWITNLHWDFGDNSTLDVPFSAQSVVSDTRTHIYASGGTYNVSVVAYDNAGDTGSAGQSLTNVTPGSCDSDPGNDAPPTISNAVVQQETSLQLPSGGQLYLYGFVTGGASSSTPFSNGQYRSVMNANGNLVAALAMTTSNSNSFLTQTSHYSIGGAMVSGYSSYTESYASDSSPDSSGVSDHFTVATSGSLVVVVALGGDEQCLNVVGLSGFSIDATNIGTTGQPNAITIGHAILDANSYTVTEQTQQCAPKQDPNNAGNLIGVFVFQPMTTTTTSLQVSVLDAATGNAISDASVQSTTTPSGQSSVSCTSDSTGSCSIQNIAAGSYIFSVTASGYQTTTETANVAGNRNNFVTLKLVASSTSPISVSNLKFQQTWAQLQDPFSPDKAAADYVQNIVNSCQTSCEVNSPGTLGTLPFTLDITNDGSITVTNVQVTITFTYHLHFFACWIGTGTCTTFEGSNVVSVGPITVTDSQTFSVGAVPPGTTSVGPYNFKIRYASIWVAGTIASSNPIVSQIAQVTGKIPGNFLANLLQVSTVVVRVPMTGAPLVSGSDATSESASASGGYSNINVNSATITATQSVGGSNIASQSAGIFMSLVCQLSVVPSYLGDICGAVAEWVQTHPIPGSGTSSSTSSIMDSTQDQRPSQTLLHILQNLTAYSY